MDTTTGPEQIKMYLDLILPLFKPQYRERYRQVCLGKIDLPVIIGTLKTPGYAEAGSERGATRKGYKLVELVGTHATTSGEGDTNGKETVLNCLIQIAISLLPKVEMIHAEVDGDDAYSLYARAPEDLPEQFSDIAARAGFVANPSKQMWDRVAMTYLQRYYHTEETRSRGYVLGAYPFILATNSAKNPERASYLTGPQRAVRIIEIYENTWHHPKFSEIVDFAVAGSPILQSIRDDPSQFETLIPTWTEMMAATTDARSSHGHQPVGIQNYAFVKLLLGEDDAESAIWKTHRLMDVAEGL